MYERVSRMDSLNYNNIIYCTNVFDDLINLKQNIDLINVKLNYPPIYVASNGIDILENISENVKFKYWGANQGWQLGALNSCLESIKFALHDIGVDECKNKKFIFSHEDIFISDLDKIFYLMEQLDVFDIIATKYNGPGNPNIEESPYYMLEAFLFSGRIIEKFSKIETYDNTTFINCAEVTFGNIIKTKLKLKIKDIEFGHIDRINHMGFYYSEL